MEIPRTNYRWSRWRRGTTTPAPRTGTASPRHAVSIAACTAFSAHSKAAGDLVAQEYGRYFGMKVGVFRGGCLTGPAHSGVELHGFLSYLVKVAVTGETYTIYGYKGKQVRDQIHSIDVIRAFEAFANDPRPGEVYNLGGGRVNSASVLECIAMVEELTGRPLKRTYVDQNRIGDHICYISDLRKLKSHFPSWSLTRGLKDIVGEIVESQAVLARG